MPHNKCTSTPAGVEYGLCFTHLFIHPAGSEAEYDLPGLCVDHTGLVLRPVVDGGGHKLYQERNGVIS